MIRGGCEEVVLEAEVCNKGALRLYQGLGFLRDKHLHRWVQVARLISTNWRSSGPELTSSGTAVAPMHGSMAVTGAGTA